MNRYQLIVEKAREAERTFHQRRGQRLRKWFAEHPECYHPPLPSFFDGDVLRDGRDQIIRNESERINIDFRLGEGWFDRVTDDRWVGLPQQRCNHAGQYGWQFDDEPETVSEMEYSARQLEFEW